jgi:tetratricopeptide (TPR) repeat protein
MNGSRIAGLLLLGLALHVGVRTRAGEEPPPSGTVAPKAPGATEPAAPGPGDEAPNEKPTNLADFVYSTDEAIELFELRVKVRPNDFTSLATLGDLYERKGRETDDLACFARAEESLRAAMALFPKYTRAKNALAVVLCDRHKFAEALEVAQEVYKANPKDHDALATVGDAQLELGRYAEAETSIRELARRLPSAAQVLARLAHLEELKGHPEEALQIIRRTTEILKKAGATPDDLAWYQFREADILFNLGRLDESGKVAEAILKAVPAHHDATASLARVRAAQGQTAEAIQLYEKAVAIAPDPSMLIALGDLYARTGDLARARANQERMERATAARPEYRRVLAVFLADHDRDLPRSLELARQDLEQRKDVYGYDAVAWALLKNGQAEEADRAMTEALRLGTQDARLFFHAGMIQHRLGDQAKARDLFSRALALNPHFSARDTEQIRRIQAELK